MIQFIVTNNEEFAAEAWKRSHICKSLFNKKRKPDFSYKFTPGGGIGTGVHVCCDCGAEHDITDYSNW